MVLRSVPVYIGSRVVSVSHILCTRALSIRYWDGFTIFPVPARLITQEQLCREIYIES